MQVTLSRPQIEVIQLQGHLNAANAEELQQQLLTAISSGQSFPLLINMSRVESMDSAGLMVMVSAQSLAQSLSRQMSLCCISPSVRIIFELTQLDTVFQMFESEADFEASISQSTLS